LDKTAKKPNNINVVLEQWCQGQNRTADTRIFSKLSKQGFLSQTLCRLHLSVGNKIDYAFHRFSSHFMPIQSSAKAFHPGKTQPVAWGELLMSRSAKPTSLKSTVSEPLEDLRLPRLMRGRSGPKAFLMFFRGRQRR
jgi:hypothetical protein